MTDQIVALFIIWALVKNLYYLLTKKEKNLKWYFGILGGAFYTFVLLSIAYKSIGTIFIILEMMFDNKIIIPSFLVVLLLILVDILSQYYLENKIKVPPKLRENAIMIYVSHAFVFAILSVTLLIFGVIIFIAWSILQLRVVNY